jgi:hypothetical protein
MGNATAMVLAGPERRRILRDLLTQQAPWTASQRVLYANMLFAEWSAVADTIVDDRMAESIESQIFARLFVQGVPREQAMQRARVQAAATLQDIRRTDGERERRRRSTRRQAVDAKDGAGALATGMLPRCIVCGGPNYYRTPEGKLTRRIDSAYCSDACKQRAYRLRKRAAN